MEGSPVNAVASVVIGVELSLLGVGPTPLRMLLTLAVLTAAVLVVLWLLTLVAAKPIDKQWPPDEPLDPTEMLWGEVGGFVQKSFAGLDLNLARDLASYMDEQKVAADTWIVQYGDPASHYYVLKKGEAELFGGEGGPTGPIATATGRKLAEGEGFGDHALTASLDEIDGGRFLVGAHVARYRDHDRACVVLYDFAGRLRGDGDHVHSHCVPGVVHKPEEQVPAGRKRFDSEQFAVGGSGGNRGFEFGEVVLDPFYDFR